LSNPSLERYSWIAGIVSAVIAIVALAVSFWPGSDHQTVPRVSQSASSVGTQFGNVTGNVTIMASPSKAEDSPDKIASLFKFGIIGNDIGWFERIAGPAVRKIDQLKYREYLVDGCKVELNVRGDGTIEIATLYVSPVCSFNWRNMDPNYGDFPPPNNMKFASAMKKYPGQWSFKVSCLLLCGNAADPEATLSFGGSHADGWIVTTLGAVIDEENLDPAFKLSEKIVSQMGREFVVDQKYECDYDLNAAAKGIIDRFRVNYVSFRIPDGAEAPPDQTAPCKK